MVISAGQRPAPGQDLTSLSVEWAYGAAFRSLTTRLCPGSGVARKHLAAAVVCRSILSYRPMNPLVSALMVGVRPYPKRCDLRTSSRSAVRLIGSLEHGLPGLSRIVGSWSGRARRCGATGRWTAPAPCVAVGVRGRFSADAMEGTMTTTRQRWEADGVKPYGRGRRMRRFAGSVTEGARRGSGSGLLRGTR